ncbi:MAG: FtsH protease activity modulator HflK [Deltaproteobacteria bacterium]|nr:FtsH protease activity modulator HflK [Deltaproteobacteria bacterium]
MLRALRVLPVLVLLAALAVWAATGFYDVAPDEQAVVLRLGRYQRTVDPGRFLWHAQGLESVFKQRVTTTLREEFGYRTKSLGPPPEIEEHPEEKAMLTGDENLVDVDFVVQYRIGDLRDWLFGIRSEEREDVIRDAARASVRAVIGRSPVDLVLTQRGPIQDEIRALLQSQLDGYRAGVHVQSVQLQDVDPPAAVREAFADVASASQDRERSVLEAQGYADKVVPEARGRAEEVLNQARAYREQRILESEGQVSRFSALLAEYQRAPAVTRERLYLETMEEILPGMDKMIMEEDPADRVVPYLPLERRGAAK